MGTKIEIQNVFVFLPTFAIVPTYRFSPCSATLNHKSTQKTKNLSSACVMLLFSVARKENVFTVCLFSMPSEYWGGCIWTVTSLRFEFIAFNATSDYFFGFGLNEYFGIITLLTCMRVPVVYRL